MKPFIFFFDADHTSLGDFYGPPCTNEVIKSALLCKSNVESRILKGDLLAHFLSYKTVEISTKENTKSPRSLTKKIIADKNLYKLLVCDLSDSFTNELSTINPYEFPHLIFTHNIWCIALPTITTKNFIQIDNNLKKFPSYIGGSSLDTGNPIQLRSLPLIDSMYISNKKLYLLNEAEDLSDLYNKYTKPKLISSSTYFKDSPPKLQHTEISIRGQQSIDRFEGKTQPSHRQKLLKLLAEQLENDSSISDFSFSTELQKDHPEFICPEDKIKNYLLNINHPTGYSKANFFINFLDIVQEDWKYLSDQIINGMNNGLLYRIKNTKHGISHGGIIAILGRNGKKAYLNTGWIIEGNKSARLVTAYPNSDDITEEILPPEQNIVPRGLNGNERWREIYNKAHNAGISAAMKCIPTPMTLENYPPVFEGLCGFANIIVKDARKDMGKWLKDNNIGSKHYRSGWSIRANPEPTTGSHWDHQSVEPKEAYANSFAKVLTDNGVVCNVEVYLD